MTTNANAARCEILVLVCVVGKNRRKYCTLIAGILAQCDDLGVERNNGYFSAKLKPHQKNYSVIEKEAFAVLQSCLKWQHIIYGYEVHVKSDHKALQFMDSVANHNARISRWRVILGGCHLKTEYRKEAQRI